MNDSLPAPDNTGVDSKLVESEARYRAVIENASDMIQSCRPDGSFEFVNKTWLAKLGYTPEEVRSLVIWDIIHPDSLDHCRGLFMRAIEGQRVENARADFVTKDGRKLPLEGNATSRIVDGKVIATHSFFRDISERLHARDLEERNQQLERDQLARYLEKMAALGKLAAGLAHELNNPAAAAQRAGAQLAESTERLERALAELHHIHLEPEQWDHVNAVKGSTSRTATSGLKPMEVSRLEEEMEEWLANHGIDEAWELAAALVQEGTNTETLDELRQVLPEAALKPALLWITESGSTRELADVVTRSSQRISDLVAAVKAYTFMDQAAEQIVDVHDGIESTLVILGHRLRGLIVKREFDRTVPPVKAFGSGLNQVWTNILDNAADAVGDEGTITIRTRGKNDSVIVEIEDDGPGIPSEHLSRVFEPFFSTKPQGEGTGLGLDTVWRIVTEEHGGTVEVDSEPGCTRFKVTLPANRA